MLKNIIKLKIQVATRFIPTGSPLLVENPVAARLKPHFSSTHCDRCMKRYKLMIMIFYHDIVDDHDIFHWSTVIIAYWCQYYWNRLGLAPLPCTACTAVRYCSLVCRWTSSCHQHCSLQNSLYNHCHNIYHHGSLWKPHHYHLYHHHYLNISANNIILRNEGASVHKIECGLPQFFAQFITK